MSGKPESGWRLTSMCGHIRISRKRQSNFDFFPARLLKPNGVYKQELDINFRMKQIKRVSVYFTLTRPLSLDRFKKIYLSGINLTSSEPDFKINLKSFKLPNEHQPLKHKEVQFMVLMYEI